MADTKILSAFRHVHALKDLSAADRDILASFSALRSVRKGETLFCKGEPSPYCFAVITGEVQLGPQTCGPGMLLEGLSLLGERPRAAQAMVSQDGQLLSIWSSRFRDWVETQRSPAGDPPIVTVLRHLLKATRRD